MHDNNESDGRRATDPDRNTEGAGILGMDDHEKVHGLLRQCGIDRMRDRLWNRHGRISGGYLEGLWYDVFNSAVKIYIQLATGIDFSDSGTGMFNRNYMADLSA